MITPLLLVLCVPYSLGAEILAVLPTPSYSHQIAYTHIWKELSLRGHKVTLITTDPLKDPKLTNLTEIDMKWTYKFAESLNKKGQNVITMWNLHNMSDSFALQVSKEQLSQHEVQNLIHNKSNFDVVLVEFLYPEFLAFAEIYKCPKIVIASLDAFSIIHQSVGNIVHPILYPEIGATFYGSLNFKERVISTLYTWYVTYFYSHISFTKRNNLVKNYFNVTKTLHELVNDVDLLFLNVNPILQPIRAVGPSTITIGGDRKIVSSTSLSDDIAEFLDSAVDGFVYFSLGSNVKSKDLSPETLEGITNALSELPYKVLWKFEADELPNKPNNVKLIKWAPQQTVLGICNSRRVTVYGRGLLPRCAFGCDTLLWRPGAKRENYGIQRHCCNSEQNTYDKERRPEKRHYGSGKQSKDLKEFLDSATNGFVYFSLGSNINSKDLTEKSLSSIIQVLGELPYKVLWKFEAEAEIIQNKPENVKMIKWAPQLGILAHPNIKVFVTQGGLQSMEETIHYEVPCVVIPFFADQDQNARLMKNKGFAKVVKRYPYIEKEELKTAILEVLANPVYKNVVKELKRLAADTPMTGLEKAIWWTEYVIRNKGAKHLRNPAADLPLYQFYLLDVIGFLLIVAATTLSVIFIVLKKLYGVLTMDKSVFLAKKLQ